MSHASDPRPSRIPQRALFAVATAALLAALAPLTTDAQMMGAASPLSGTWRIQGSVQQAQATVQQAVEPAITALRPDLQPLARSRIAESTWVPSTITIQASPQQISIALVGAEQRTLAGPPNQPQNVYSRSGVRASMTQSFRPDGGIQQAFVAMDGTQYNQFTPDPSGQRLTLDVLMQSQRFAQDIRFRLTYERM